MPGDDEVPFYQSITERIVESGFENLPEGVREFLGSVLRVLPDAMTFVTVLAFSLFVTYQFLKVMIRKQAIRDPQLDL